MDINFTPATRRDMDSGHGGRFYTASDCERVGRTPAVRLAHRDAVSATFGLKPHQSAGGLGKVAGMKIYNGKPGGRGVIHDEGRVIPALRQLDDFEMFVVGGSEPLEYVLAAQPYTLAAAAVDDLCRQVAPLGLEVAVYRHAAWRHQLATLVLIARRGVLKDVWQSE